MTRQDKIINYNIRKFDMKNIKREKIVVLVGRRGTGKSTLIKDIIYHVRDVPVATCICRTRAGRKDYSTCMPGYYIHKEYTKEIIESVVMRQDGAVDKWDEGKGPLKDPHGMLIMDDCLSDAKEWAKDKNIREIFFNGRHLKLLFIFAMQFALGIPPDLRGQVDYIFLLKENIPGNKKRLYEHYAGIFPSADVFYKVFDTFTENYECLVIDNTSTSNNVEDVVFWYKAKVRPPFHVGCKSYWKIHHENFNPDHEKEKLRQRIQEEEAKRKYGSSNKIVLINRV